MLHPVHSLKNATIAACLNIPQFTNLLAKIPHKNGNYKITNLEELYR